ncbi:hypothetical protein C8Q78DRAFT_584627 [Trametes maxima]|nr:hypothetical protein C8Q78DRAFT_584627 [Trametes maxima]
MQPHHRRVPLLTLRHRHASRRLPPPVPRCASGLSRALEAFAPFMCLSSISLVWTSHSGALTHIPGLATSLMSHTLYTVLVRSYRELCIVFDGTLVASLLLLRAFSARTRTSGPPALNTRGMLAPAPHAP